MVYVRPYALCACRELPVSLTTPITLVDETVLLHLAPERYRADFQCVCRLFPIAAKVLERALDHHSFLFVQVKAVISRAAAAFARFPEAARQA